jgi:Family of unknown function (DUF5689)
MKIQIRFKLIFYSFAFLLMLTACLKKNAYAIQVTALTTDTLMSIKDLRKLHVLNRVESLTKSLMIEGVVVGNDEHDNIYKSIIIQDSTGGIVLLLDGTNLYQNYPLGAIVRVRLKNLFLTDYRKMQQLVASIDTTNGTLLTSGLPVPLFEKHISILRDNFKAVPLDVNYKTLSDTLQGRLIRLSSVEFSATDTGQTYADYKNKIGASRSLKFCTGGTIYLRTSGYADFAGVATPSGNGSVIGIYSVYNSEKQLLIRDTSDILLKSKRCTGTAWLQNLPQ